jgi:pimeloyl-ACP methyl ester carboxylesterase
MSDGAELRLLRAGRPGGRRVLVSHGVGFAAGVLRCLWRHLADDHDLFLLDLRGHGANAGAGIAAAGIGAAGIEAGDEAPWRRLAADMAEVTARLGRDGPVHGIFHSFSGVLALHAAVMADVPLGRLVLFEPPLAPAPGMPLQDLAALDRIQLSGRTLRRQRRFDATADLERIFRDREEFRALHPAAPVDLAESLLVPDGTGWALACTPEREAALYAGNEHGGLWPRLAAKSGEVLVVSGRRPGDRTDFPASVAPLVAEAGGFDHMVVSGVSHLLPLERPALLAGIARAYLAG